MSTAEPMAVVAPSMDGDLLENAAHVPHVEGQSSSDDGRPLAKGANGNGNKRSPSEAASSDLSSEDEKPLVSNPAGSWIGKEEKVNVELTWA